jgi:AAA15 family ATPase/GTPase
MMNRDKNVVNWEENITDNMNTIPPSRGSVEAKNNFFGIKNINTDNVLNKVTLDYSLGKYFLISRDNKENLNNFIISHIETI